MIHGGGGAKRMERGKTKVTCKKINLDVCFSSEYTKV